ncbi:MAG: hypothetical protein WCP96_20755 [Methylococcaceae bacterium]
MSALTKIKSAGFDVSLHGDSFKITPSSSLSMQQREFLKSHKAEILTELKAKNNSVVVICYSPNGKAFDVEARDPEHAAWLQRMNPHPNLRK